MSEEPLQVIAEFTDYRGLEAALRACQARRDISLETLDEIVGAPRGYFSKVLAPQSQRGLTLGSLGWALGGLGIKCLVVDDPDTLPLVQNRMKKRDKKSVRNGVVHNPLTRQFMRKIRRKGLANRWAHLSKRKRRELARNAALARWKKR
jgi:hypothetical protein